MGPFSTLTDIPLIGWLLAHGLSLLGLAVHVLCGLAVLADAAGSFESKNQRTVLVPGYVWAAAALLGGVMTTAVYWLLHHSTLRPPATQPPAQDVR